MLRARQFSRRMWRAWAAVAAAGALAAGARWLDRLRPVPVDLMAASEIRVTDGADAGIGTLREAIIAADRSSSRVRILLEAPRIRIATPLPPVVNPRGVVVESAVGSTMIDAGPHITPVLDIAGPDTVISRLRIDAPDGEALRIRADGARLSHVIVRRSNTAVFLADGIDDLVVDGCEFEANGVAIHVSTAARRVVLANNRFRRQQHTALWAVAAAPPSDRTSTGLTIRENTFDEDGQPLVVMNQTARIERNTIAGARAAALLINGASAVVRSNRVRSGIGFGIAIDDLEEGLVADNEIDHNCAGAILVRNARNTRVSSNRLYANGYGVVMLMGAASSPNTVADNLVMDQVEDGLYIIGGSPIIRRNRLLDNRHAALRVASLRAAPNQIVAAMPLLSGNVLDGNGRDTVQDEFRPSAASPAVDRSSDCSWRVLGGTGEAEAR